MDKIALQAKLDEQKWNDSVSNHRDMCGAYDYCAFCDKTVALPCATAFEEMNKPQILPAKELERPVQVAIDEIVADVENVTDLHSSLGKKFDYDKVMAKKAARKSLTFAEKYAFADDIIKERYAILKDAANNAIHIDAKAISSQRSPSSARRCASTFPSIPTQRNSTTDAHRTLQRVTRKCTRKFLSNSKSTANSH